MASPACLSGYAPPPLWGDSGCSEPAASAFEICAIVILTGMLLLNLVELYRINIFKMVQVAVAAAKVTVLEQLNTQMEALQVDDTTKKITRADTATLYKQMILLLPAYVLMFVLIAMGIAWRVSALAGDGLTAGVLMLVGHLAQCGMEYGSCVVLRDSVHKMDLSPHLQKNLSAAPNPIILRLGLLLYVGIVVTCDAISIYERVGGELLLNEDLLIMLPAIGELAISALGLRLMLWVAMTNVTVLSQPSERALVVRLGRHCVFMWVRCMMLLCVIGYSAAGLAVGWRSVRAVRIFGFAATLALVCALGRDALARLCGLMRSWGFSRAVEVSRASVSTGAS